MKSFTIADFERSLDDVGIVAGDTLMVHSALFVLGKLEVCELGRMPAVLAKSLMDFLGPEGTVVVPIYNYENIEFFKNYRLRQMGALSEYIADLPQSRRTYHTIFSVAAVGRLAEDIEGSDALSAFEENGPFEFLLKNGAKVLLIGTGIGAASVIHIAEERVQVPYRYWMEFPKETRDPSGKIHKKPYKMLVRDLEKYPVLHLEKVEKWLREDDLMKVSRIGAATVIACGFKSYVEAVVSRLRQDPESLVRD